MAVQKLFPSNFTGKQEKLQQQEISEGKTETIFKKGL
jgi:hypothetical protein